MARLLLLAILYLCPCFHCASSGTDCRDLRVQPVDQLPPAYLVNLDTNFYKKFVSANGIPIMSSNDVTDFALKECARIIRGVTGNFLDHDFLTALINKTERIALWASNATACSIPEVAQPCTLQNFSGGLAFGNILILQETSFECDARGNAWIGRVLVHEFNHGVNSVFDKIDKDLQPSLNRAYDNAKATGIWPPGEYAMTNNAEYYAIGAQTWFEANEVRHCEMGACDRFQLQKKDPQLYDVVARVYQQPDWLYKCNETCDRDQEQKGGDTSGTTHTPGSSNKLGQTHTPATTHTAGTTNVSATTDTSDRNSTSGTTATCPADATNKTDDTDTDDTDTDDTDSDDTDTDDTDTDDTDADDTDTDDTDTDDTDTDDRYV